MTELHGAPQSGVAAGVDDHAAHSPQDLTPQQLRARAQELRQQAERLFQQAGRLWIAAFDREREERNAGQTSTGPCQ